MAATDGRPGPPFGLLIPETDITFVKASDANLKLKGSSKKAPPNAILAPNFKFEDVGIGGLDSEFAAIFRRAFASRVFPPGLVDKLGIQHVRGLLLFGPPGTGKTLMARQIGKMLNAREPKVVNGPEILSKYVGASEENIRKLFADAEKEARSQSLDSCCTLIISSLYSTRKRAMRVGYTLLSSMSWMQSANSEGRRTAEPVWETLSSTSCFLRYHYLSSFNLQISSIFPDGWCRSTEQRPHYRHDKPKGHD